MQYRILDPAHQGMPVAAFEHPETWQGQSNVAWNFQNTSQPATVYAVTYEASSAASLEFLPVEACYWLEPNHGFQAIGQQRFGVTLLPPTPAPDVITRWLIPKYRGNRQNLQLVGVQPVPNLAQLLNAVELQTLPTEGVRARITYLENGLAFTEEFYACRYAFPPTYGAITQQNWGLVRPFCYRAPSEQFEALQQTFWSIAVSLFYNAQWQQLFQQITQQLNGQFVGAIQAGYDKLRSEAQFQQQLTSYYQSQRDQQSASVAASVERQHQLNDARTNSGYSAQAAWGDAALSNRTAYEDPSNAAGNYHYDHGQHQWVWTDSQGNFIPSNDANFDPNLGSDRTWTLAKKAGGG